MSDPQVTQCDRCSFVARVPVGKSAPDGWDINVLGEILCPLCVERAAKRAES